MIQPIQAVSGSLIVLAILAGLLGIASIQRRRRHWERERWEERHEGERYEDHHPSKRYGMRMLVMSLSLVVILLLILLAVVIISLVTHQAPLAQ
jgi:hypothetical protein